MGKQGIISTMVIVSLFAIFMVILPQINKTHAVEVWRVINGYVHDGNGDPVGGAWVEVICHHNGIDHYKYDFSKLNNPNKGFYEVKFTVSKCAPGDAVDVNANKDDTNGSNNGTANDDPTPLDIIITDASAIPEFGTVVALLTVFASVFIFLQMRKKVI